jgi:hypothetical protein
MDNRKKTRRDILDKRGSFADGFMAEVYEASRECDIAVRERRRDDMKRHNPQEKLRAHLPS